ncbi:MAG: hypothetical protein KDD42_03305 [Bdellovibrionales bacterium]|nr:hypothetical protein [Bdellovibrionales bacterium]
MDNEENSKKKLRDANTCIGLGAGVGVLGASSVLLTGAMCPVCYVAVPALIGYGALERYRAKKSIRSKPQDPKHDSNGDDLAVDDSLDS